MSTRSGEMVLQAEGYKAFVPKPLPPDPALHIDAELAQLLAESSMAVGKLNGLTSIVQDPDLFIYIFVRKEALLSSQIEGTQCSLEDVLSPDVETHDRADDIEEVANYVLAMNEGLDSLEEMKFCTRLMKNIHKLLMQGVRGENRSPGNFRTSQNWLGPPGSTLQTATFVPPPAEIVERCIKDLEHYITTEDNTPPLIKAAFVHAQFETIHPFLDGNGRLGRLLITFLLRYWQVLEHPLLYISYFFKQYKSEYYARLTDTRSKGDWESWVKFFLRGVKESADLASSTALGIFKLHEIDRGRIQAAKPTAFTNDVYTEFCKSPIQTVTKLLSALPHGTRPKIQRSLNFLEGVGVVSKVGVNKRKKKYVYIGYLTLSL